MGFCAASNQIRVFRACVQRNCEKEEQTLGTILYARCVCSHKTNNRTKSKNCAIVWWFSAFVLLLLFFSTLCTQCAYNVDNSIRQSNSQCDSLYAVFVLMWALFLRSTFCESTTKSKNANATKYILNLKLRNPVQCNWKRMQYVMAIKFIWWMVFCTLKLTRLLTKKIKINKSTIFSNCKKKIWDFFVVVAVDFFVSIYTFTPRAMIKLIQFILYMVSFCFFFLSVFFSRLSLTLLCVVACPTSFLICQHKNSTKLRFLMPVLLVVVVVARAGAGCVALFDLMSFVSNVVKKFRIIIFSYYEH